MQCYVFHDSFGEVVSSGKKIQQKAIQIQSKFNTSIYQLCDLKSKMRQVDPEKHCFWNFTSHAFTKYL